MLDRLRGRTEPERPPPWRVEGAPSGSDEPPARRPRAARFWWWLLAALAVNWIVMSLLVGPDARPTVSYTFFVQQVDADNVLTVTSTGDGIQGTFDEPVSFTSGGETVTDVTEFATQRPTFAEDDLFRML